MTEHKTSKFKRRRAIIDESNELLLIQQRQKWAMLYNTLLMEPTRDKRYIV